MGRTEDRINSLPDEILSLIQARLTLKEAIATTILSRRWQKLGLSHPILDFEGLGTSMAEPFVQRVDKVLEIFKGSKLHKFRVVFPLFETYRCHMTHIDDWVSFACSKGVSELELDYQYIRNNYYFPIHVFAKEEMMNSHCASSLMKSPKVDTRFDCLRDLCLRFVNLLSEVFDVILFRCSSLERLLLMYCHGFTVAKNTAPHLKLKSLELYFCNNLITLELSAPNLVSFKYQGSERTLCIKDAQQLAFLRLSLCDCPSLSVMYPGGRKDFFNQFSAYLPMLESLVIDVNTTIFRDMNDFTELCVFSNLKQLVLEVTNLYSVRLGYQVAASIIGAT